MLISELFFFNDTATTEIYTLSLHDALPICIVSDEDVRTGTLDRRCRFQDGAFAVDPAVARGRFDHGILAADRKSTRLNSSHSQISYAVFCLKKKKKGELGGAVLRLCLGIQR